MCGWWCKESTYRKFEWVMACEVWEGSMEVGMGGVA